MGKLFFLEFISFIYISGYTAGKFCPVLQSVLNIFTVSISMMRIMSQSALSKTCRDARTTPGQYNRQRRQDSRSLKTMGQQRRWSIFAPLSPYEGLGLGQCTELFLPVVSTRTSPGALQAVIKSYNNKGWVRVGL